MQRANFEGEQIDDKKLRIEMVKKVKQLHDDSLQTLVQIHEKTKNVEELTQRLQWIDVTIAYLRKDLERAHVEQQMSLQETLEKNMQHRDQFRIMHKKSIQEIGELIYKLSTNQNKINFLNVKIEEEPNKATSKEELQSIDINLAKLERKLNKKQSNTQTLQQNDELVLLKAQICSMQTALAEEQSRSHKLGKEIRQLKLERRSDNSNKQIQTAGSECTEYTPADMREVRLTRLLEQERAKVRALEVHASSQQSISRANNRKCRSSSQLLSSVKSAKNLQQKPESGIWKM